MSVMSMIDVEAQERGIAADLLLELVGEWIAAHEDGTPSEAIAYLEGIYCGCCGQSMIPGAPYIAG